MSSPRLFSYNEQDLGALKSAVEKNDKSIWNNYFKIKMLEAVSWRADFRNANLRGINLQGFNLSNANFNHADLTDANLSSANLTNTLLGNSKLINANLRNAHLINVQLTVVVVRGKYNRKIFKLDANLTNADLFRARIDRKWQKFIRRQLAKNKMNIIWK